VLQRRGHRQGPNEAPRASIEYGAAIARGPAVTQELVRSGVPGLDYLLGGGFPARRIYLVHGPTGSGKTTLGTQFAMEGLRAKETTLYVTLAESHEEMRQVAESHGWDLAGLTLFAPQEAAADDVFKDQYTLFHPGEVELTDLITKIIDEIRELKPVRVVIDSLADIRLLARDPLMLLRQMRLLRTTLTEMHCTVLLLNNRLTDQDRSGSLETFAHGIIELEYSNRLYGAMRRCISIIKLRGAHHISGQHDARLTTGGLTVYPRLIPEKPDCDEEDMDIEELISSGSPELDRLCGGGLEPGSSTMIIGSAGTGKSTVAAQFTLAAAERGECSSLFLFDETERSCRLRWDGMNMPLNGYVEQGVIETCPVDPTEISPGEFCHRVRTSVERRKTRIVVIDSLSGYMQVMPESRFMEVHLFELLKYLNSKGVLSILIVTQHGILGSALESPIDVSYLIDTILLMRYFEADGEVHKAISVVKKRLGQHERTIRECQLGSRGLKVGEPLDKFHGVLTGIPAYRGDAHQLL
jgi:circadian clock protein KaiC